jgi:hypothetical protein
MLLLPSRLWWWRRQVSSKRYVPTNLHSVTSQKNISLHTHPRAKKNKYAEVSLFGKNQLPVYSHLGLWLPKTGSAVVKVEYSAFSLMISSFSCRITIFFCQNVQCRARQVMLQLRHLMFSSDGPTFSLSFFLHFGKSSTRKGRNGPRVNDFHWLGNGRIVNNWAGEWESCSLYAVNKLGPTVSAPVWVLYTCITEQPAARQCE